MSLSAEEFDMAVDLLTGMEENDAEHLVENIGFNDREKLYKAIRRHHLGDAHPESMAFYAEEED